MKRAVGTFCMVIMVIGSLTGCLGDIKADEFSKYFNKDMIEINANYKKLKTEINKLSNFVKENEYITNINDVIIPNINESLEKLSKIEITTEELKSIKDKYKEVLNKYKESFAEILEAVQKGDISAVQSGIAKFDDAVNLLNEYNKEIEELAREKGIEIKH